MAALLLHLKNSTQSPAIGYAVLSGYLVEGCKVECRLCSLLLVWLGGLWQAVCTSWWELFYYSGLRPKYMAALLLHLNNSAQRPAIGDAVWSGYLVELFKVECRLCSLLLVWLGGFWQAVCTGWWELFYNTVVLGQNTWLHCCCTLTTVPRALALGMQHGLDI